ncbi:MAG: hypothetical protein ACR2L2_18740 [Acidobacteriota bacterium]
MGLKDFQDPIPLRKSLARKSRVLFSLLRGKTNTPLTQQQMRARIEKLTGRLDAASPMQRRPQALWTIEKLVACCAKHSTITLNDDLLPPGIQTTAHTGLGFSATESSRFDPAVFTRIVEGMSHPDYRLFCYESAGSVLAFHENDAMLPLVKGLEKIGLLELVCSDPGQMDEFRLSFRDPELQRLIANGYGRILYFKSRDVSAAVGAAYARPFLNFEGAVQGIGFAYLLMNARDWATILRAATELETAWAGPFRVGLVYTMEFFEWMTPGFLDTLPPQRPAVARLLQTAAEESRADRKRGFIKTFALERQV